MGYYTRYTVSGEHGEAVRDWLAKNVDLPRDYTDGNDQTKWYEHNKDICRAMRELKINSVDLHGSGEEQGDVWDKEYRRRKDGKIVITRYAYESRRPSEPTGVEVK